MCAAQVRLSCGAVVSYKGMACSELSRSLLLLSGVFVRLMRIEIEL